jgi:hypothetical protein
MAASKLFAECVAREVTKTRIPIVIEIVECTDIMVPVRMDSGNIRIEGESFVVEKRFKSCSSPIQKDVRKEIILLYHVFIRYQAPATCIAPHGNARH